MGKEPRGAKGLHSPDTYRMVVQRQLVYTPLRLRADSVSREAGERGCKRWRFLQLVGKLWFDKTEKSTEVFRLAKFYL